MPHPYDEFLMDNEDIIKRFYNKDTLLEAMEIAVRSEYERRRFQNYFGQYPVAIYERIYFREKV